MSEFAISVPDIVDESLRVDEPPQRKRKVEVSGSSAREGAAPIRVFPKVYNDPWDEEEEDPLIESEFNRQFLESDGFDVDHFDLPYGARLVPHILEDKYDYSYELSLFGRVGLHCHILEKGTNLKLVAINKYNEELRGIRCFYYHITLEATDTSTNSLCNFQTCVVTDILPNEASFLVQTEISRLKVPSGPRTIGPERRWKDEAVDDSYKGKLPKWLTKDEMAAISNNGMFYELQESDLQANEWLQLYAEFAFHLKWMEPIDLRPFLPLKINKVIVKTKEFGQESLPCMKLKANNAIFYISFKGNGDPSGVPVEYQAVVRKTLDGMPGHMCLEVDCLAYNSS